MSKFSQISLTEKNAYDYIDKIIYLEKNLGKHIGFNVLNPVELMPYKEDLNLLTKKISEFIGLKEIFIVTKGARDKGGEIEYDGVISYIDINEDVCKSFEQTIAVIAHEIMHKYLKINGLFYNLEIENEVLTDIATVYVGLGKLSLNGNCVEDKKLSEQTITTTVSKVGYLDLESFCFIYLLICKLRNINKDVVEFGLNRNVIDMLNKVNDSYLFSNIIYKMDSMSNIFLTMSDELRMQTRKIEQCSTFIKKLDELVQSLNTEKNIIYECLEQINKDLSLVNSKEEYNPVLRKLSDIRLLNGLHVRLEKQNGDIEKMLIKTQELERLYDIEKDNKKKKKFFWF